MPRSALAAVLAIACVALLAGCAATVQPNDALTIRGALAHTARAPLPPQAVAVVELKEDAAGGGRVVAERRIALEGTQTPIAFSLTVEGARLAPGASYALRGGIVANGQPLWASAAVPVAQRSGTVEVGTLAMRPARAEGFVSTLACGDRTVTVGFTREGMLMTAGDETFTMRRGETASGARFEAVGDPATFVWVEGRAATVEVRGERYPQCTVVDPGPKPFRATGNEPGWRLDIAAGEIALNADFGATRLTAPAVAPEAIDGGRRYAAATREGPLTVTVLERRCSDTMTGMPHPNAVTVEFAGRKLEGCGGDPASLLAGAWTVQAFGGAAGDSPRVTLTFNADGRLSGQGPCNAFSAAYSLTGEGLAIARPAPTRRTCAPAVMQSEQAFFATLAGVRRFEIAPDGALLLHTDAGRSILARRS